MSRLVYKAEVTPEEFDEYKREKIDTRDFKMTRNPAGDMFFMQNDGNTTIFVYRWVGGYLIQETE